MNDTSNLSQIEARCSQIMNSPYLRKEAPPELQKLRAVLEKVEALVKEDVPSLIAEVKRLRSQNRKLEAELEALRSGQIVTTEEPASTETTEVAGAEVSTEAEAVAVGTTDS